MALVGYSDSETSDTESVPAPKPAPKASTASKPAPQRLVDRANPGKIVVSLPSASTSASADADKEGPPAKKQRTGGGGFNAMLPAPKRTGVVGSGVAAAANANGLKRGVGRGLGVGVNLKTGAAPAFSREVVEEQEYDETGNRIAASRNETQANTRENEGAAKVNNEAQEVKLVGKPMMFKPLSVMNKKKKKTASVIAAASAANAKAKAPEAAVAASSLGLELPAEPAVPAKKPKVSLFSVESEEPSVPIPSSSGDYQPLLHTSQQEQTNADQYPYEATQQEYSHQEYSRAPQNGPQSLDSVASDLQLTAAQRRQLFGRNARKDLSSINLVNFNTDAEYRHNEELRASGETVQHNPVRAIAPGKHSLQQLVNAATSQKDALEEHFASGRRNKKEAGSKYGW